MGRTFSEMSAFTNPGATSTHWPPCITCMSSEYACARRPCSPNLFVLFTCSVRKLRPVTWSVNGWMLLRHCGVTRGRVGHAWPASGHAHKRREGGGRGVGRGTGRKGGREKERGGRSTHLQN